MVLERKLHGDLVAAGETATYITRLTVHLVTLAESFDSRPLSLDPQVYILSSKH